MYGACSTFTVPASSTISSLPSGRKVIAVGRLKPVARTSFTNWLALATLTVIGAETVTLPAASRARAVSVCAPLLAVRVSHVSA